MDESQIIEANGHLRDNAEVYEEKIAQLEQKVLELEDQIAERDQLLSQMDKKLNEVYASYYHVAVDARSSYMELIQRQQARLS